MEQLLFGAMIIGAFLGVSGVFIASVNDRFGFQLFVTGAALLMGGFLVFTCGCLALTF